MRFVIDGDAGWEFQLLQASMLDLMARLLEQRRKLKDLNFECVTQRVFHLSAVLSLGHGLSFRIANTKNGQNCVVFARENVGAQNIEWNNRKRSRDFRQKMQTVPSAKRSDAVSELWKSFPIHGR